jgi:cation diffusion facilitator CzcD-associated flavoprotein CzcO
MATGLAHWERMPAVFAGLTGELVSHTSRHSDFSGVRGQDVTVMGAGASAIEAATVLHEQGAVVRLLTRGGPPEFAGQPVHPRPLKERLLYPPSALGPGRLYFILERAPTAVHHLLSDERRIRLTRTRLGPLGAWWIRERFERNVEVHPGCTVTAATDTGSRLRLTIRRKGQSDWDLTTDRVVCGTGFEVDVDRHPVLDPVTASGIERIAGGAPRLNRHFESSVPGLYFVGAATMFSFGPLFRFVAGAAYAAPALARHLARSARPARRPLVRTSSEPWSAPVPID